MKISNQFMAQAYSLSYTGINKISEKKEDEIRMKSKSLIFYLKRVQKIMSKTIFYKGDPPEKWELEKNAFFIFTNIHFVNIS